MVGEIIYVFIVFPIYERGRDSGDQNFPLKLTGEEKEKKKPDCSKPHQSLISVSHHFRLDFLHTRTTSPIRLQALGSPPSSSRRRSVTPPAPPVSNRFCDSFPEVLWLVLLIHFWIWFWGFCVGLISCCDWTSLVCVSGIGSSFGGFLVRVSVTLLSIDFEVRVLFFSLLDEFVLCLSSLCLDGEIIEVWGEKIQVGGQYLFCVLSWFLLAEWE